VACSETTIHVFEEGHHVKLTPKTEPLSCFVKDDAVSVVGIDGTITVYKIDSGNAAVALEVPLKVTPG
jgi:hypothetical protein